MKQTDRYKGPLSKDVVPLLNQLQASLLSLISDFESGFCQLCNGSAKSVLKLVSVLKNLLSHWWEICFNLAKQYLAQQQ